jgi:hypothetical protein
MAAVIRKEKYQRGPFGTLVKWAFIAFNLISYKAVFGETVTIPRVRARAIERS